MLLSHHREFLASVRQIDQTELERHQGYSAATNNEMMALDHISIGPDFVAVAGVFSDHAFLEYLYQQQTIDYVELNQVFKSTNVRTTKEEPDVFRKDAINIRQVKTASPANWGLSRINQRERGSFDQYTYDSNGG